MKQIVILERLNAPSDYDFKVAFRLVVPEGREAFYADETTTSAYKDAAAALVTALQNGQVLEVVETVHFEKVEGQDPDLQAITAVLESRHAALQSELETPNPYIKYGTSWDGTAWTQTGIS